MRPKLIVILMKFILQPRTESNLRWRLSGRKRPVIAEAEEYMRKFLMDKAGNDLDSFLNDFWLYLEESAKSMEDR